MAHQITAGACKRGFCPNLDLISQNTTYNSAMTCKKITSTAILFTITLLFAGFLQAVVDGYGHAPPDGDTHQQRLLSSLEDNREEALARAATVTVKQYQRKTQSEPTGNATPPSFFWCNDAYDATTEILSQPWFFDHPSHSCHRVSGWKDSNLLYKSLAIQHA